MGTDREIVSNYLRFGHKRGSTRWVSSFTAALRDARAATGRSLSTGKVIPRYERKTANWLGALGYMVLLDQIGECFRPNSKRRDRVREDFIRALRYFTDQPEDDIQILYGLRCALAHDYSLFNRSRDPRRQNRYLLLSSIGQPVVLRRGSWDGTVEGLAVSAETAVNLRAFGDLAEQVVTRVKALHTRDELCVDLPGGATELFYRFAFTVLG